MEAQRQDRVGSPSAAISRELVQAHKELFGRGPTKARTHILDDCVLVLLREGHTQTETTLAAGQRQREVAQTRVDVSGDARERYVEIVERNAGRKVIGFMSSSQQGPDLLSLVFVFENTPILSAAPSS